MSSWFVFLTVGRCTTTCSWFIHHQGWQHVWPLLHFSSCSSHRFHVVALFTCRVMYDGFPLVIAEVLLVNWTKIWILIWIYQNLELIPWNLSSTEWKYFPWICWVKRVSFAALYANYAVKLSKNIPDSRTFPIFWFY